ncbi:hypothetical protein N9W17_06050 [Jannaschia sp.]|nr:hypothetical protein [Jannaschia sp.]
MPRDQMIDDSPDFDALTDLPDVRRVLACASAPAHGALARAVGAFDALRGSVDLAGGRMVICPRTNLAIEGGPRLNVGMVAVRLRALEPGPQAAPEDAPAWGSERALLWAVAERVCDLALPRLVQLRAGEARIDILGGPQGVRSAASGAEIAGHLRAAMAAGQPVEITLGDPETGAGDPVAPATLLGAEIGDWRLDAQGWPMAAPACASLGRIAAAGDMARALAALGAQRIALQGSQGRLTSLTLTDTQ